MESGTKCTGDQLYDSASRIRLSDLPAFALECLPNRNSLLYGDIYGIQNEASTIFRGTLRYEGIYNKFFCIQENESFSRPYYILLSLFEFNEILP